MYIKDEDKIIQSFQNRLDSGEELIFKPEKMGLFIWLACNFGFGLICLSFGKSGTLFIGLLLTIIGTIDIVRLFSKDGVLMLTGRRLSVYKFNRLSSYLLDEITAFYPTEAKLFTYLVIEQPKHRLPKRIGQYSYPDIQTQILQKLVMQNIEKRQGVNQ